MSAGGEELPFEGSRCLLFGFFFGRISSVGSCDFTWDRTRGVPGGRVIPDPFEIDESRLNAPRALVTPFGSGHFEVGLEGGVGVAGTPIDRRGISLCSSTEPTKADGEVKIFRENLPPPSEDEGADEGPPKEKLLSLDHKLRLREQTLTAGE